MTELHGSELAFEIDANDAARIAAHALFSGAAAGWAAGRSRQVTYWDTPDRRLLVAGLSLRVGRTGRHWRRTIATDRTLPGAIGLAAWTDTIPEGEPGAEPASGNPAGGILREAELAPLLEARLRASTIETAPAEGPIAWVLESFEVAAGGRQAAWSELRCGIADGGSERLVGPVSELALEIPLLPAVAGPVGHALSLLEGAEAGSAAVKVEVEPDSPAGEAFSVMAGECLRQILANRRAVAAEAAGGIHQMRIGIRRLRAVLMLFGDAMPDEVLAPLKSSLRWLGGELAPAREIDALLADFVDPIQRELPEGQGLDALAAELRSARKGAGARAAAAVADRRFAELALAVMLRCELARRDEGLAEPIGEVAARRLSRLRKRLAGRKATVGELAPEKRHRLRVSAKKLRYAEEFFDGAATGRKARQRRKESLAALRAIQAALGEMNDIDTRLSAGMGDAGPREAFAAGLLAGRMQARIPELTREADKALAKFRRSVMLK